MRAVTLSPAMGTYLNMANNNKGMPPRARPPTKITPAR